MAGAAVVEEFVLVTLVRLHPEPLPPAEALGPMELGADGLGLDSIGVVELLLSCEARFGTSCDALLDDEPLTFARVFGHFARH